MIRFGYACICLGQPDLTASRTCRLANATPERLTELIGQNLDGLASILRYNVEQKIALFRLSSSVIPFASHSVNTLPWDERFAEQLTAIGAYVKAHGLRLSAHPGQYTVLNSVREQVVADSIAELDAHARLFDAIGLDSSHKLILHVGTAAPDKATALERFRRSYDALPDRVRARLVLENDDRIYGWTEVNRLCRELGAPHVMDPFHHAVFPTVDTDAPVAELLEATFETWRPGRDGRPKIHFSTQAEGGRRGSHADYLDPEITARFLAETGHLDMDIMLEAKAKDLALARLRADLALPEAFAYDDLAERAVAFAAL